MKKSVSTAIAGVTLALTTSTLALIAPATSANAASAACTAASAQVSKANSAKTSAGKALAKAKKAQKKAKKAQLKAKKAAVSAKKANKVAKVKLTKKKLKAANKKVKLTKKNVKRATATHTAKTRGVSAANATKAKACKSPAVVTPTNPQTEALTAVLQLILKNMGGNTDVSLLGADGVKGVLNGVAPELGDLISDDLLGNIVAMLHNPIHSATDASKMFQDAFGKILDPKVLQDMASGGMGSFDPTAAAAMFKEMFAGMIGKFAPADFKIPEFNPTMVTGMLAQLTSLANPDMLKNFGLTDFTKIFEGMMGGKMPALDPAMLTALVNKLSPSQISQLKGTGILGAVIGGLTNGAGGLPGLNAVPVLGPILTGVLNTLKDLLCLVPLPVICAAP